VTLLSRSYEKVHYEFRPAKQVERRMLLATFQQLMACGFPISNYQYTGMGSVYFIDFIMFHKYLGIKHLWSVEADTTITRRVMFNRPFGSVEIKEGDVADIIPRLSTRRKHIIWLDYDEQLNRRNLDTIGLAMLHLPAQSILVITVDVEPPGSQGEGPQEWKRHFEDEAGEYISPKSEESDFAKTNLHRINASIIDNCCAAALIARKEVSFIPLFNFLYKDGHKMLSLGGMIGSESDREKMASLDRHDLPFLAKNFSDKPYEIKVPLVTRKERLYLDSVMPCSDKWKPKDFEMKPEDIEAYRQIYRFFPAYTEMLL
jgi:hypothetical protein